MKKSTITGKWKSSFFLSMLLLLPFSLTFAQTVNNAGFESGLTDWYNNTNSGAVSFSFETTDVQAGTQSLKASVNTSDSWKNRIESSTFDFLNGRKYKISFWAKTVSGTEADIKFILKQGTAALNTTVIAVEGTDWQQYNYTYNANTDYSGLYFRISFMEVADYLLDDITIEDVSYYDCNGDLNGIAYTDNCGDCVGGNTGVTSTCTVTSTGNAKALETPFYGFNTKNIGNNNFRRDTNIIDAWKRTNAKIYRYPGGTFGNSFNWHTGTTIVNARPPEVDPPVTPTELVAALPADTEILWMANVRIPTPETGYNWWELTNEELLSDDVLQAKIQDILDGLALFNSLGRPVKYLELGNEFYFDDDPSELSPADGGNGHGDHFPYGAAPSIYIHQMGKIARAVKAVYPDIEIAVIRWKTEAGGSADWNDVINDSLATNAQLNADIDAVTNHWYQPEEWYDGQTAVMPAITDLASTQTALGFAFDYIAHKKANDIVQVPTGKELWITEGDIHDPSSEGTWIEGLREGLIQMAYTSMDKITMNTPHMFQPTYVEEDLTFTPKGKITSMIYAAGEDMNLVEELSLGGAYFNAQFGGPYPDLVGLKYSNGGTKERLILINCSEHTYSNLDLSTITERTDLKLFQRSTTTPWATETPIEEVASFVNNDISLAPFSVTIVAEQEVINTFLNGDFEAGINTAWSVQTFQSAVASLTQASSENTYEGAISAQVNVTDLPNVLNSNVRLKTVAYPLVEGETELKLSAYAKSADGPNFKFNIKFYNGQGSQVGSTENSSNMVLSNTYTAYNHSVAIPADAVSCNVEIRCGNGLGTYYFDNVSISTVSEKEVLVQRSEYESIGDEMFDLSSSDEGTYNYSLVSGNDNGYYALDAVTGKISIANTINDTFDVIHTDVLVVNIGATNYKVTIVDAYDYFIQNLDASYSVMSNHNEYYSDPNSEWTAMNNLWGKGDAVPNQDFRIATIHKNTLPDSTILIWDVPSNATAYNGASVWCYHNIFWGDRKNYRDNLDRFPFKIQELETLTLDFDFEQLFGNDQFKFALNTFMTDEPNLSPFSDNDGDFFFVFDQKGTWIPNYPVVGSDTTILGKQFANLYDINTISEGYERRRLIIKDEEIVMNGTLDLKNIFDRYIADSWLDQRQHIYHLQAGIEVTSGYGAVRINQADMTMNLSAELAELNGDFEDGTSVNWTLKTYKSAVATITDETASNIYRGDITAKVEVTDLPTAGYSNVRLITNPITLKAGETNIDFSLFAKSDLGSQFKLAVKFYQADGTEITPSKTSTAMQMSTDYEEFIYGVDIPSGASTAVLEIRTGNSLDTYYLDDVHFEYSSDSSNREALSIDDTLDNQLLTVYPNPVDQELNLFNASYWNGNVNVEILTVTGQVIFNQEVESIGQQTLKVDLPKLQSGLYMLRIKSEQRNFIDKIYIK